MADYLWLEGHVARHGAREDTFLRFPESSFSGMFREPGPMLALRVFLVLVFLGDGAAWLLLWAGSRPSAMFSLSGSESMAGKFTLRS
jgi:hypothetical protein